MSTRAIVYSDGITPKPVFAFYTDTLDHVHLAMRVLTNWELMFVGEPEAEAKRVMLRLDIKTDVKVDTFWLEVVNSARNSLLNGSEAGIWSPATETDVVRNFHRQFGWEMGDMRGASGRALIDDMFYLLRMRFPDYYPLIKSLQERFLI